MFPRKHALKTELSQPKLSKNLVSNLMRVSAAIKALVLMEYTVVRSATRGAMVQINVLRSNWIAASVPKGPH